MSLELLLPTKTNLPLGSTLRAAGTLPAATGEPLTRVNAPVVALMVYSETLFELEFATYANFVLGSTATAEGFIPAANGEPAMALSAPVVAFS
jgi:hypothetical protein